MLSIDHPAALARAGHNVLNLPDDQIRFDLMTDVPGRCFVPEIIDAEFAAARRGAAEPDLATLAEDLYGRARYVFSTKGRSAELALVPALGRASTIALTHGLFRSTQYALVKSGHTVEIAPRRESSGTADLDLVWLAKRFAAGGVGLVYLEPTNNALGGWPLSLQNMDAVATLCKQHDALLLLDATRIFTNGIQLGLNPFTSAQALIRLADAFTVSCAKELLIPSGSLLGVRTASAERLAFTHAFSEGSHLEPLSARVRLARAMEYIRAHPETLIERRSLVFALAEHLRRLSVEVLEPPGGHAVYVVIGKELVGADPLRGRALEGLLYARSGIRALIHPNPLLGRSLMRLPLALCRYESTDMKIIAGEIRAFLDRAHEAPVLAKEPREELHDAFSRFTVQSR